MTMLPGWYPDPSGAPGTRYWDGRQWTGGPQLPRKRVVWPWIVVGAVVLLFGGCGALIVIGAAISKDASKNLPTPAMPSLSFPAMPSPSIPAAPAPTTTTRAKAAPAITYEVQSDGALSTITYFDAMNDQKQIRNVGAPWSLAFDNQATYPMVGVGAQTTGLRVSCQIRINGQVRDQQSATGRYAVVNCSASV